MIRGMLAMLLVTTVALSWTTALAQEEHPPHDHAGHEAGEHGDFDTFDDEGHAPHRRESLLMWLVRSLGLRYTLLLPTAALFAFGLTLVLLIFGKGNSTGAAIAFVVSTPFLIGLFGMFDGMMTSFVSIARSSVSPKPSEIADGISTSIVTPLVGLFLMAPSFLLATAGLSLRSLLGERRQSGK